MLFDIAAVSMILGGAYLVDREIRRRVETRRVLNQLLAVASADFNEAVQSLMKTPEDLTDEALETLSMMSSTGFAKNSEKRFLAALRAARRKSSSSEPAADPTLSMRPELKELFFKAVAAWFNIMTHKSSRYHQKISLEALRAEADHFVAPRRELATASEMQSGQPSFC